MEFCFVKINSVDYQEGVKVRKSLFFEGFTNAKDLLNDVYEQDSIHLVAKKNEIVVGTGRLTIFENKSVISQMTVLPSFQKQQIGKQLLQNLLNKASDLNIPCVELSARITALEFYQKNGFKPVGEVYASKKTGVLHRKMILNLVVPKN